MRKADPTNEERADRAEIALDAYPGGRGEDMQTAIADLLADLRHLIDTDPDCDWDRALATADLNYSAEA